MNKIEKERLVFEKVDSWMNYINELPAPKDDIDRVHNHYLCTNYFEKKRDLRIKNIIALPAMLICLAGTSFLSIIKGCDHIKHYDLVQFVPKNKRRTSSVTLGLPLELIDEFKEQVIYDKQKRKTMFFKGYIDKDVFRFWLNGCRYRSAFYMNFSVLTHLFSINKILHLYNPKCIVTTESENDFTTSAISAFCESKGVEYIGIMHGENFVDPLHAFVRFSRFYVWGKYCIDQYVATGSPPDFFRIFTPNRFHLNLPQREHKYFISYYLQEENRTQLKALLEILLMFTAKGLSCKVRLHPRASDRSLVSEMFASTNIKIEFPEMLTPEESYAESKYIVAKYSTVLTDAYCNGLNAVIDDISDRDLYNNLEKLQYIYLKRIKLRLSDLVNLYKDKG